MKPPKQHHAQRRHTVTRTPMAQQRQPPSTKSAWLRAKCGGVSAGSLGLIGLAASVACPFQPRAMASTGTARHVSTKRASASDTGGAAPSVKEFERPTQRQVVAAGTRIRARDVGRSGMARTLRPQETSARPADSRRPLPTLHAAAAASPALTDMRERAEGEGSYVCYSCAPEEWPYQCTACKACKAASAFRAPRSELERKFHRRCRACETCADCDTHFTDFRSCQVGTRRCSKCYLAASSMQCSVCMKRLKRGDFPASEITNASRTTQNLFPRCRA